MFSPKTGYWSCIFTKYFVFLIIFLLNCYYLCLLFHTIRLLNNHAQKMTVMCVNMQQPFNYIITLSGALFIEWRQLLLEWIKLSSNSGSSFWIFIYALHVHITNILSWKMIQSHWIYFVFQTQKQWT
jgi:hypothetical protein